MGGVIHVGVRKADREFETVSVWTNNLGKALHSKSFLEGDVSVLDKHLEWYRTEGEEHGYGVVNNDPGSGSYGYVFVDCVARRIVSASNYEPVSFTYGMKFQLEKMMGTDESRQAAAELLSLISYRMKDDDRVAVGPYASLEDLFSDPDFSDKNVYCVTSPYWAIEDVWPREDGFTTLRDLVKGVATLNYSEEIAWSKLTGDRQPVIDY